MKSLVERQVFTTWYTPEEKLPEEGVRVVVTVSGKSRDITLDHSLEMAVYYPDGGGWCLEDLFFDPTLKHAWLKVHAWADLEPYKGGST